MRTRNVLAGALLAILSSSASAQVPTQINVEIDYMLGTDGHDHRPTQKAIDAVVQMFACQGITLNVVIDQAIPEVPIMRCPLPGAQSFFGCGGPDSFYQLKSTYAGLGTLPGWHYCIFGHEYDDGEGPGSSGLGERGGNDFIVTLSDFSSEPNGSDYDQAATFAHELGHNLGLRHYSPDGFITNGDYAPNYASLMSYQYQLSGVRTRMECLGLVSSAHLLKDLDYSHGRLPDLNEIVLSEAVGVGIHAVDWDCDGTLDASTVSKDLDIARKWCEQSSGVSNLDDYDDWANIVDSTDQPEVYTDALLHPYESCITRDEQRAMDPIAPDGLLDPSACWGSGMQPTLAVEPCVSGLMVFVDDSNPGGLQGTGENPFGTIGIALGVAPDESVLYLQPGNYGNSGGSITIDRPLTLAGPGTAVVDP